MPAQRPRRVGAGLQFTGARGPMGVSNRERSGNWIRLNLPRFASERTLALAGASLAGREPQSQVFPCIRPGIPSGDR